jgi:hypothetical protein
MLQAMVAFLPLALTFPENPNSIDSPLAWNPLSTGIGKLPPGSLRAWWDASKLNANDIYWGYFSIPSAFVCWTHIRYQADGLLNQNLLTLKSSQEKSSLLVPGLLFKMEGGDDTIYQIVSAVANSNSFIISPNFTANFSDTPILFANLTKWPDGSGNREHMGFWAVADTYNPSIYMLDSASGKIFRDGEVYHFGNGAQTLTGLTDSNVLRIGHAVDDWAMRNPVVVHEVIIGQGTLSAGQREDMEGYLAWKWQTQLQLPLQHSYATSAPPTPWDPSQLGNDLTFWLDANCDTSVFANSSCSEPAGEDKRVACWQDLSNYGRNVYQNANFPIYHTAEEGLKGVYMLQNSWENPSFLATTDGATWLNNQNYFVAIVAKRSDKNSGYHYRGGPLQIGTKSFFPFIHSNCLGTETVAGNPAAYTPYYHQRSTLVLQGNARNQPFYQPYFNRAMKSSLTTRSPPTYLHEQPYLLAVVADFFTVSSNNLLSSSLLGTILPNFVDNLHIYKNSYIMFGGSKTIPNRVMLDQGWAGVNYQTTLTAGPAVYLLWKKDTLDPPLLTINGVPDTLDPSSLGSLTGFLNIHTNQPNMFAMGDAQKGGTLHLTGSIYEAMVLTGPKIKYGHQRLIEGYLAWKWGLQNKLPRSHSYRRVPPAR